jgi:hypothetical protein
MKFNSLQNFWWLEIPLGLWITPIRQLDSAIPIDIDIDVRLIAPLSEFPNPSRKSTQ